MDKKTLLSALMFGGGGSSGGGIAVEFEDHETIIDGGHYVLSISDAEPILYAYKNGASVVFHIPGITLSGLVEGWATLYGYQPGNSYREIICALDGYFEGSQNGMDIKNGKFAICVYYD